MVCVQERLLSGLLAVWTTAAQAAGIKLPGSGEAAVGSGAAALEHQRGAADKLLPLLPPFLSDIVLAPQLATLKDGRWGLLDGRLAWQVHPCSGHTQASAFMAWGLLCLGKNLVMRTRASGVRSVCPRLHMTELRAFSDLA